jgi:chromosome segregation ATPase
MSARALAELESAVSSDEFHALEEKVYKTIELLKSAREAKAIAERDVSRMRAQLEEREEEADTLREQMVNLRREREEVRGRVEKMLKQIDAIDAEVQA